MKSALIPVAFAAIALTGCATGLLSKSAGFRLLVTGSIGAKEIERLIAKLELDKGILAEPDPSPPLPTGIEWGDEPEEAELDLDAELGINRQTSG